MGFNVGGVTKFNVVLATFLEPANPSEEAAAQDLFSLAAKYFRMEMYEKAIGKCNEILEGYGNSTYAPAAQLMIGDSRLRLGDPAKARTAYDKVISTYPQQVKTAKGVESRGEKQVGGAFSGRGDIHYEQKNWEAAKKEYLKVVVDKYKGKQCRYRKGFIWYDHAKARLAGIDKKIAEAKKTSETEKLAKLKSDAKKLYDEGMGLYKQAKDFHRNKQYDPARNRYYAAWGKFSSVMNLYPKDYHPEEYYGKAEKMIDQIKKDLARLKKDKEADALAKKKAAELEAARLAKVKADANKLYNQGIKLYNQGIAFHNEKKWKEAKGKYIKAKGKFVAVTKLYHKEKVKPRQYYGLAKTMIAKVDAQLAKIYEAEAKALYEKGMKYYREALKYYEQCVEDETTYSGKELKKRRAEIMSALRCFWKINAEYSKSSYDKPADKMEAKVLALINLYLCWFHYYDAGQELKAGRIEKAKEIYQGLSKADNILGRKAKARLKELEEAQK